MIRSAVCAALLCLLTSPALAAGPEKAELPAAEVLAAGVADAEDQGKRVFLLFGSPDITWCILFERYLADPQVSRIVEKHLVLVPIDVARNPGGPALYQQYGPRRGLPAWTILDSGRTVLVDSMKDSQNVGFPYEPHEVAHFLDALRRSCPDIGKEELTVLQERLDQYRRSYEVELETGEQGVGEPVDSASVRDAGLQRLGPVGGPRGRGMAGWQLLLAALLAIGALLAYVFSLAWVAEDANRRGRSGGLTALYVALTWPAGLLAWLALRPRVRGASATPVSWWKVS